MTTEQLRELDAWVAKNVMGWKRLNKPFGLTTGNFFHHVGGGEVLIHYRGNQLCTFHPSESPADAMKVLQVCMDKFGAMEVSPVEAQKRERRLSVLKFMITAKINCSAIDKTRLFKGAKGTYLDLVLVETPNDQYGNDYMIVQGVSKEEREKGVKGAILGNAKVFKSRKQDAKQHQDAPSDGPPPF